MEYSRETCLKANAAPILGLYSCLSAFGFQILAGGQNKRRGKAS